MKLPFGKVQIQHTMGDGFISVALPHLLTKTDLFIAPKSLLRSLMEFGYINVINIEKLNTINLFDFDRIIIHHAVFPRSKNAVRWNVLDPLFTQDNVLIIGGEPMNGFDQIDINDIQ